MKFKFNIFLLSIILKPKEYSICISHFTHVSGIQKRPKVNTPYPIPENIQNNVDNPTVASIVGLNLPARKNDVTAIEVAKPEPISLALEGSNSDWNIHIHAINPALSPGMNILYDDSINFTL